MLRAPGAGLAGGLLEDGIDIRRTSRRLVVRAGDRVVADTVNPLVLYEPGFAPAGTCPAPTSPATR
jgi:uncharacterized protein (DUF427 family)